MIKRVYLIFLLLLIPTALASTLQGTIYDSQLEIETNVLITVDSEPAQQYLAKQGTYSFELAPGTYTLVAQKGLTEITETITISQDGTFTYDIFLIPDFSEENAIWQETQDLSLEEVTSEEKKKYEAWRYWVAGIIVLILLGRFYLKRKKYGPLGRFRKVAKQERRKTQKQHQKDIDNDPSYLKRTVDIIKQHDGRITQKQLRKELLPLSEAKVSLIVTELEHKNKVEKIKQGRGNVILLKE